MKCILDYFENENLCIAFYFTKNDMISDSKAAIAG